jgi:putative oxidoreductase
MISQEATLPLPSTPILERIGRLRTLQRRLATQAQPVILLVLRVLFGSALILTGWSKLANLDRIIGFFSSLGIPMASINAPLVAGFELVGGILLVLGLFTRAISVPLVVVLTVALSSAHAEELGALFSDPGAFISAAPVPYLAVLLALVGFGPGKLSADHLLARRYLEDQPSDR